MPSRANRADLPLKLASTAVLALLLVTSAVSTAQAQAAIGEVLWESAFLLQGSGGIENPIVRFGFNPQPEPPALLTVVDVSNPAEPALTIPGMSSPQSFEVFFAIGLAGMPLTVVPPSLPGTNFSSLALGVTGPAGGATFFDVFLGFMTSSGGVVSFVDAVSFNPQPEPPAFFGSASDWGMEFSFTALSDATVTLRVFDAQGTQLSFAAVPEPTALALLALGLAGLGGLGWRRAKRRPA